MNTSIIRYILGHVLKLEAIFLLLPCIVGLIYREEAGFAYLISFGICGLLGVIMSYKKPESSVFYLKEGCVATALSWIFLSIFGCIPFILSGDIPSFTNALFETISGFTTTGASILSDVESLSHCSLFWRSFTHWIGGMGVLVFLLAIIPLTGGSHINIMRAESPGPTVGKLVPKVRYTARILYYIYIVMTILQIILLLLGNMPIFDAITTTFGTAGTGGFGIKNDSMMSYSPYIQWVVTIFMILFGINFNAYYLLLLKRFRNFFEIEEVKYYLGIIAVATVIIFLNVYNTTTGIWETLRHAIFQVASIITTTGYATADFDLWSETAKTVLVMLMFVGACAGSTGGGIKVSRFIVAIKAIFREIYSYIHPKSIKKIKVDGKPVDYDLIHSISIYFVTFILIFVISIFLVSFEGNDAITNFTAVATTLNNVGPGLNMVGPTCNFGELSILTKFVLMFDMLAGRLELFPILILFHPSVWKDAFSKRIHK